jgi:hypothetical protein
VRLDGLGSRYGDSALNAPDLYARIEKLSELWLPLEINVLDLEWLASRLLTDLSITLPDVFPTRDEGIELVELVEAKLLAHAPPPYHRIRDISPNDLVDHFKAIAQEIKDKGLLADSEATNVVSALFAWLGCIGTAKTLRDVDSQGQPYTDEIRRRAYARIEKQWCEPGGAWVRYGVTLARRFEGDRIERSGVHRDLIEDWVPRASPYWDES